MTKCYDCEFLDIFNKSDIETIVYCNFEKLSKDTNQELV